MKVHHIMRYLALSLVLFAHFISLADATESPPGYGILPAAILNKATLIASKSVSTRDNWFGLICIEDGCELRPAHLKFDRSKDIAVGQTQVSSLPTTRNKIKGEFTIALIGTPAREQSTQASTWPVSTWYTRRTPRNSDDVVNGSLGVTIRTSESSEYRLLPRWNVSAGALIVYLESRTLRQRLGQISPDVVSAGIRTRDILIWAGDLDGDGKIDLITRVSNISNVGGLHLWLSSYAKTGELVGLAASLNEWSEIVEDEG